MISCTLLLIIYYYIDYTDSSLKNIPLIPEAFLDNKSLVNINSTPIGFSKLNPAPLGVPVKFHSNYVKEGLFQITLINYTNGSNAYNNIIYGMNKSDVQGLMNIGNDDDYVIAEFRIEFLDGNKNGTDYLNVGTGSFRCYRPDEALARKCIWYDYVAMHPVLQKTLYLNDSIEGWITFKMEKGYPYLLISFTNDQIWFICK